MSGLIRRILGQYPDTWGIFLLALWALILAIIPLANLFLLAAAAGAYDGPNQSRLWIVFTLNVCLSLGFGLSAYGLWRQQNWGRLLFLWLIIIWSVFNLLVLLLPNLSFVSTQTPTAGSLILTVLRFIVQLLLPVWYLNLAHIKVLFQARENEGVR